MMDSLEIGLSVIYTGTVVASVISMLVIGLYWNKTVDKDRRLLYRILIAFFACVTINWLYILLYIFQPAVYTCYNIICYLTFPLTQVVLYHFIYVLTRVPGEKPLNKWHYYIVLFIVAIFGICSLLVPYEVQLYIVTSRGEHAPGYELYSWLFTLRIPLKAVYSIVYACLSWILLLRYRRTVVNYSADMGRASLDWIYLLLGLTLTLTFIPVFGTIAGQSRSIATFVPAFSMVPIVIQLVILCYYTINGNYVIIENSSGQNLSDIIAELPPVVSSSTPAGSEETGKDKNEKFMYAFEEVIRKQKPYLNPQLRITDLAELLATNRTYLSLFINRTYGMNFSRYINRLRLREMELLSRMPGYEKASITELALSSGFSSYRSYRKFRLSEEAAQNERPVRK